MPVITGGIPLATYKADNIRAILVKNPESVGPIKYRYVMMCFVGGAKIPDYFVTSEKNEMQDQLLEAAGLQQGSNADSSGWLLGIFSDGKHSTLNIPSDWGDFETFEQEAIRLVCKHYGVKFLTNDKMLKGRPSASSTIDTGMDITKSPFRRLAISIALIIAVAMLVFPPWKEVLDHPKLKYEKPLGYSVITNPPEPSRSAAGVEIDFSRLILQIGAVLGISLLAIVKAS